MAADLRSIVLNMALNALKHSRAQPQSFPVPKRAHLSTGRAMLLGAGLATAGRALASERGRDLVGSLRERLGEHAGNGYEDEEKFDEPEGEEDEDFEDEEADEPEAEEDEDFEEERPRRRRRTRSRSR